MIHSYATVNGKDVIIDPCTLRPRRLEVLGVAHTVLTEVDAAELSRRYERRGGRPRLNVYDGTGPDDETADG